MQAAGYPLVNVFSSKDTTSSSMDHIEDEQSAFSLTDELADINARAATP